jgi:site-specific DNA-cytosine methylase
VSDRRVPQPRPGNRPRVGSLCTGYGGLDLAVELVLGGQLAWYAETDPHARTVLAAQWPDVANLGDIRAVDWSTVEPVDVLTAGFPCQNISNARQTRRHHRRALQTVEQRRRRHSRATTGGRLRGVFRASRCP